MKGFIGGIVAMVLVLVLGLVFALLGFVNMRADNPPSKMESALAGHAMDASVARAAPKLKNPVAADEASLVAGARLYRDNCTLCHGDPAHPKSPLADSLNPPPPQFMDDMAGMPENQNFYILEHGIRWTGMPSFQSLPEADVWHLALYVEGRNQPRE